MKQGKQGKHRKCEKKRRETGPEAFDRFYLEMYGTRWAALKDAMLRESTSEPYTRGLQLPYYMDRASIIVAMTVDVMPGNRVLDMCAAPGGKTVVLASLLGGSGSLVANDRSASRRGRLRNTIETHLPPELRSMLTVTSHDATKWGLYEQNEYDRILLDAPCSSERHLLHSPKDLEGWSRNRTKRLQIQSAAMVLAALEALKSDGILVYSTCTVSCSENEAVIERCRRKRPGVFDVMETKNLFPDEYDGMGPMFYCKIRKR
jgi:5-methylcytosine rRNA methyltransferase NSUN4